MRPTTSSLWPWRRSATPSPEAVPWPVIALMFTLAPPRSAAATHDLIEQPAEGGTVAEAAMPVLGEGGVVGHCVFEAQAAEPPIGQVQLHLLAQTPLGADAVAVAHDEHAQHQLGVDRRTPGVAVVLGQMLMQTLKVQAAVDATKQVTLRYVVFDVERVEESILPACLSPHHLRALQTNAHRTRITSPGSRLRRVFQQNSLVNGHWVPAAGRLDPAEEDGRRS